MIGIIIGFLVLLFGLIGFAVEVDNYLARGIWDDFGLIVSSILIYVGGSLFYYGIRRRIRKKKSEVE